VGGDRKEVNDPNEDIKMKSTGTGSWWVVGLMAAFCAVGLWRPTAAAANGTNLASFQKYEAYVLSLLQQANPSVPVFQVLLIQNQLKATEDDVRNQASFLTIFADFQVFVRLWQDDRIPGNYSLVDASGTTFDLTGVVQQAVQGIVESLAHDPALSEDLDDTVEIYTIQQWTINVIPTDTEIPGF